MSEDSLPSIKGLEYIKRIGKLQVQRNIVDIDSALKNWFKQIGYDAQHIEFHINPFSAATIKVRIKLTSKKMQNTIKQQIEKYVPIDLDSIIPSDNSTIVQFYTYEPLSSRPLKSETLKAFIEKYGTKTTEEDQGLECIKKGATGFDFEACIAELSYCHVKCCASCTFSSWEFAGFRSQVEYYCKNPDILRAAYEIAKKKYDFATKGKWIEVLPFGCCGKQEFREQLEVA